MGVVDLLFEHDIELRHGKLYLAADLTKMVEVLDPVSVVIEREDRIVVPNGVIEIPNQMPTWLGNMQRVLLSIYVGEDVLLTFRYGCRTGYSEPFYVFDNNFSNVGLEDDDRIYVYPEGHSQQ